MRFTLIVPLLFTACICQGIFYDSIQEPFCPYTNCVTKQDFMFQANASRIGPNKVFAISLFVTGWPRPQGVALCYSILGGTSFQTCDQQQYLSDPPLGYVDLPLSGKVAVSIWMSDLKTTNFTFLLQPHIYDKGLSCEVSGCGVGPLCEYCPTDCSSSCDPAKATQAFCHCSSSFTRGSPYCGCIPSK